MLAHFLKLKNFVLDIFWPRFCLGCNKEGSYVCEDCEVFLSEIENIEPDIFSVWEYEGLVKKAIEKVKFEGYYDIIEELTEKGIKTMWEMQLPLFNLPKGTVITYVPMWPKKERQRGFNQAQLIAKKLGELFGLPVFPLLKKIKDNPSQVGLGPKERKENVKGVFSFSGKSIPENVLLVDDVYTTGATVGECKKVLRKAGVKKVFVFTLARALRG